MIIDFTSEESKALKALEDGYKRRIKAQEKKILELRPDDPEPDEEAYERIQAERIPEPTQLKPEPIEYTEDDIPVYRKEELDAYHETPEYKAYSEANQRANDAVSALFDEWYNAGSEEWKAARIELEKLHNELNLARTKFMAQVEERQFSSLGDDLDRILEDAQRQVDQLIVSNYRYFEKLAKKGSFSSKMVRVQADGSFLLDTTEEKAGLYRSLERHTDALARSRKYLDILERYIDDALRKSELVGDTGKRGGEVTARAYDGELVIRPDKYVTTVDRVSFLAFSNKLTKEKGVDVDALYDVPLDKEKKGKVLARAAIDYNELLKNGAIKSMPQLAEDDYDVHDAIVTQLYAGNRSMTYDMIYRAMTGKVSGKVTVPDEARSLIDEALSKFKGEIRIEYTRTDKQGNTEVFQAKEPVVTFQQGQYCINGKLVDGVITIPDDRKFDPPLLRWARFNRNEIDTRDIALLDVPKINNGKESRAIKMCLYRRLISMRNKFEREKKGRYELNDKERTIRYDYVYKAIGLEAPDVNKRRLVKDKIDRCMKYWQKKDLIAGYEHKRDKGNSNNFYAVMVSFVPKV